MISRPFFPLPLLLLLLLGSALVLLTGCDRRGSIDTRYERDDLSGEETHSRSISFEADGAETLLRDAAFLVSAGDFEAATTVLRDVYRDASVDEDFRAKALLEWAEVEAHMLNPDRDPSAAQARLELLVETFPNADCRFEAEAALERLLALPPPAEQ